MTWYVFKSNYYTALDPRAPLGECLGKIEIPPKMENGIDINLMQFDLHLRKNKLVALGEGYKHYAPNAYTEKLYTGFRITEDKTK